MLFRLVHKLLIEWFLFVWDNHFIQIYQLSILVSHFSLKCRLILTDSQSFNDLYIFTIFQSHVLSHRRIEWWFHYTKIKDSWTIVSIRLFWLFKKWSFLKTLCYKWLFSKRVFSDNTALANIDIVAQTVCRRRKRGTTFLVGSTQIAVLSINSTTCDCHQMTCPKVERAFYLKVIWLEASPSTHVSPTLYHPVLSWYYRE